MTGFFDIDPRLSALADRAEALCRPQLDRVEEIARHNGEKVLAAFNRCRISESHLKGTTGYGYDDRGRDGLDQVFATAFGSEDALVRHTFVNGTHTLATALFGVLRPGDRLVSATGRPYDTLEETIGLRGERGNGSLLDCGVAYGQVDLLPDSSPDLEAVAREAKDAKMIYIQRSRGYSLRPSLTVEAVGRIAAAAHAANPQVIVMVDNCYGEFVEPTEPTQAGADLMAGSLIKNPGGGIAPTGGYIAGRHDLIELCAQRLTCPGLGREVGCTLEVLRELYLGFFLAPQTVAGAVKTAIFAAALYGLLGYETLPRWDEPRADIIQTICTGTPEGLVAFCRGIQKGAPVDSFVTP